MISRRHLLLGGLGLAGCGVSDNIHDGDYLTLDGRIVGKQERPEGPTDYVLDGRMVAIRCVFDDQTYRFSNGRRLDLLFESPQDLQLGAEVQVSGYFGCERMNPRLRRAAWLDSEPRNVMLLKGAGLR